MNQSYNIKGDIFGGITAAVVALPLGLAFGVASGLGATAGIYGAIILGFFASIFGGTKTQISGPTGPMTVVIASSVVVLNSDINAIATVVLLAGFFQIAFAFLQIGRYVKYIPYPVISGFMSGIGVIIIVLQINPFLGLESQADIISILTTLPANLLDINFDALLIATATLLLMLFTPIKISRVIPSPLIALGILTIVSLLFNLDVETIGAIPSTLPSFILPTFNFENYRTIISLAITLALLGSIDTLLTSLVADSLTKQKHNSNRELFGQGLGNTLCALTGSLAGAGATMRTVINIKSGGTTKLSGVTHSIVLLLIVLFLAPLASQIPLAVLAGILIKVGLDILDYKFLKVIKTAPRNDLFVMLTVFFVTVFIDLITAVGLGIVLASLLIVYRITKATKISTTNYKPSQIDEYFEDDPYIRVVKIEGALFFGSTIAFENEINALLDTKILIIDCLDVPFIDITAIFTLQELITNLNEQNIDTILLLKPYHQDKLLKVDKTNIFANTIISDSLKNIPIQCKL
jgi:SulP family sulfate permease